jgi:Sulfotransferase family
MLVSHRHKFIYTKTVKTGGTSVESYFEPFCMVNGEWSQVHFREEYVSSSGIIGYRGHTPPQTVTWWNHMPAANIKALLGEEIWSNYFKFCIVRNPYEKAVSAYYFFKKNSADTVSSVKIDESSLFEQWLESSGPPIDRDKYLIDGQFCLDHVIRYESLNQDLKELCHRFRLPWKPAGLPNFKRGIRPKNISLEHLYTEKSKALVSTAYQFELAYFGYSFPDSHIQSPDDINTTST